MIKKTKTGPKDFGKHAGREKKNDGGFDRPRKDAGSSRPDVKEKKADFGKKTFKSRPDKRDKPREEGNPSEDHGYTGGKRRSSKDGKSGSNDRKFSPREGKFVSREKKQAPGSDAYTPESGKYGPKDGKAPAREARHDRSDNKDFRHKSKDSRQKPKDARYSGREERPAVREKSAAAPVKARKDWEKDDRAQREAGEDDRLILKGRHEVVQALESGQTIDSIVISTAVKGPVGKIVRELAGKIQVPVKEMNPDLFERKFGEKSQGIVAVCGSFTYSSLEELARLAEKGRGVLVALNHVEDARNLGAIVRTVEASGCSGVLIPKHRSAGMSEWAVRTAQGAASYLPVARVNNIGDALEQLKDMGFWIVGLDGDAEKRYDQVVYSGKLVLVAGGEDAGLGERVRKVCDDVVVIPLAGKTPSLNVSVSTAVVLYEIIRQKDFFKNS